MLLDNLGIHTTEGSRLLRQTLGRHEGKLRLVYTPPYDPEANPSELFYHYDEHPELDNQIRILQNYGLVKAITYNNARRYVMTEELVRYLLGK